VEESKLESAYLVDTITALIEDSSRLQRMSAAAKALAHPKAVEEIAAIVQELTADSDQEA
jgi:UDP-N-acetylglucosamine:LPS N-acetylglucosamine transferase